MKNALLYYILIQVYCCCNVVGVDVLWRTQGRSLSGGHWSSEHVVVYRAIWCAFRRQHYDADVVGVEIRERSTDVECQSWLN